MTGERVVFLRKVRREREREEKREVVSCSWRREEEMGVVRVRRDMLGESLRVGNEDGCGPRGSMGVKRERKSDPFSTEVLFLHLSHFFT